MVLIDQLKLNKGKSVTIEFDDGEILDVVLLGVDSEEHEDITFDVIGVRKSIGKTYDRGNVYVAALHSIRQLLPGADGGSSSST